MISFGDEKEDGHKENAAKVQNGSATKQTVALDVNANANSSPPSSSSKRAASLNRAAESNSSDKEANGEDGGGGSYRDSWKQRQEQQNTMVFNFSNTKRDVTHIENDGRDISRRSKSKTKDKKKMIKQAEKAKDPGVIVLFGPSGGGGTEDATADFDEEQEESEGESSSDSECDVNRPVSPCKFTFVGANAGAGKSSLRGGQLKRKKMSISFKPSLTEVYEYPAFEPSSPGSMESADGARTKASGLKSNSAVGSNLGGLGSYTPSKIQMTEAPFQLGVSRNKSSSAATASGKKQAESGREVLRPIEDAVSWSGSSSSSDLLF